jgi:hypothetical protein
MTFVKRRGGGGIKREEKEEQSKLIEKFSWPFT